MTERDEHDAGAPADGPQAVRLAFSAGEVVPPPEPAAASGPPADHAPEGAEDASASRSGRRRPGDHLFELPERLPLHCPVIPLGKTPGFCHYLDAEHFQRVMKASEHSRLGLVELFGREQDWMLSNYPKIIKGEVKFDADLLAKHLIQACAAKGAWSAKDNLRGRGGWLGDEGELVVHFGDRILSVPAGEAAPDIFERKSTGAIGGRIYPTEVALPLPASGRVAGGEGSPGEDLFALLSSWTWARPRIDPMFLLGWVGCAFLGGAIPWRPMCWITGDRATGKSTLHELIRELVGQAAIVSVTDTTSAGIYQALGHSTLPVAIDELEAEDDNRRAQGVIKLARAASSGGVVLRGGAEGRGVDFVARSCFLFSSILIPPLMGQDRSRMAFLELGRLKGKGIRLDHKWLHQKGAEIRRRMMDGWYRWQATLDAYRVALADAGHGGRGADQFGSLLAAADLILYDAPPSSDELEAWGQALAESALSETDDAASDHARWLQRLLTSILDPFTRGDRYTVAVWISIAAMREPGDDKRANETLQAAGLRYFKDRETDQEWLAVADSHAGLAKLHEGSHWGALSGTAGVWRQAAQRVEGAVKSKGPIYFHGGTRLRCTLIPLDAVIGKARKLADGSSEAEEGL
jgi:hypothetical protein